MFIYFWLLLRREIWFAGMQFMKLLLIWVHFYREKLEPDPPKFFPYLQPGIDFRPETSPYFPKDFDIEKPPHDAYAQAPR
jgi:hypothetical protein